MKRIYKVHVKIAAPPLALHRTFLFNSEEERGAFIEEADKSDTVIVIGFGVDHLMIPTEAIAECERERASVEGQ